VSELKSALVLPDPEFSSRFGFEKQNLLHQDVPIVVSCLKGGRAEMANVAFRGLGYSNTKVYPGSFLDWVANGGAVEKN
jgi:rhodanese-related sulfurtransferase